MKPKILSWDIETTPNLGWVWAKYDQNVIDFQQEWELLSFCVKYLGGKTYFYGRDEFSEKELVKRLHDYMDEADILIAHNGDKFDIKKANAKFLEFGFSPPSPYKSIDTLRIARRYFALTSNKLGDLGEKLGLGHKVQTGGFSLWQGCIKGYPKSWALMAKYNRQDVVLLEKIYLRLRPWITNHPVISQGFDCPNCASSELHKRGFAYTRKHKYQRWQCQKCSAWTQSKI